jgi:hypothetical protein
MNEKCTCLGLLVAFASATSAAQSSPASDEDGSRSFGALFAPAALPAGTSSAYGFAGVPEVGAGFRQGFGPLELEGRVEMDYFDISMTPEVFARIPVTGRGPYQVAPLLGVGAVFNSGATYVDADNFPYVAIRVRPGANLSWRIAETASLLGEVSFPWDFTVSEGGGYRFQPMAGGGAEMYLGQEITAGVLAQVGADVIKEPRDFWRTRFAFSLRVGIGYRFF